MTLYTIGFKGSAIEDMISVLNAYEVDLVIDVRNPSTRYDHGPNGKFHLPSALRAAGIDYKPLEGAYLTFQTEDLMKRSGECKDFSASGHTPRQARAAAQLRQYISGAENPALLSVYGRPLHNAVFSLISGFLSEREIEVRHIDIDGTPRPHADLEDQLVDFYFRESGKYYQWSKKKLRQEAYKRHRRETGG